MIEMIIAFVLVSIGLSIAAAALMGSLGGASDSASLVEGRSSAMETVDRFGADVRGTRSIGRDGSKIADPIDLKAAVRTDGDLRDVEGNLLDWRDVIVARRNQLTVQSDVVDEAAGARSRPECVTWRVDGTRATPGWAVIREVRAYTNACSGGGGAVVERDEMTPRTTGRPVPGTGSIPPLFSYVVTRVSGTSCAADTLVSADLTAAQRNRVTGIGIDFSGLAERRGEAGRAAMRDVFTIRSRAANDYQFAMGCTR